MCRWGIMKHVRQTMVAERGALVVTKLLVALLVTFCLDSTVTGAADEALTIAKQGNFYIGGNYVESNGDMPMVGQAFVEYQIPQRQTHPEPRGPIPGVTP